MRPMPPMGQCPSCLYPRALRIDGTVRAHDRDGRRCPGSGQAPAGEDEQAGDRDASKGGRQGGARG